MGQSSRLGKQKRRLGVIVTGQPKFTGRMTDFNAKVQGSAIKFLQMMSCLDEFDRWFNLATPQNGGADGQSAVKRNLQ